MAKVDEVAYYSKLDEDEERFIAEKLALVYWHRIELNRVYGSDTGVVRMVK